MTLIAAAVGCYLALHLFLRFSSFGIRIRAAGQNALLASQRGIHLHRVFAAAWGLSTFTGGVVGMLLALDSGVDSTLAVIGLKAFPAALVGGLDSLWGAAVGALIVAVAEVFLIQYVDPLLSDVVPFFVLIAVLAIRPWGLFGSREELDRV
jgi:branched-chain amino acid transport system permease protein